MNPDIVIPTCKSAIAISAQVCDVQGFSIGCKLISTCQNGSAAFNRNYGLDKCTADIVIMVDDDIAGFYPGWWQDLIAPLEEKDVIVSSARLIRQNGSVGMMMFVGDVRGNGCRVPRVPTAAIAFRRDCGCRFDENFVGSGFEDDDFMASLQELHPSGQFAITNKCRLIHLNEKKNQDGQFYEKNKAYFESKWETLHGGTVRSRRPVGLKIPKIIHFIWLGSDVPDWAQDNIDRFCSLNDGYSVIVHRDDLELLPELITIYDSIDGAHAWERRSDLLRLSILLRYGGWCFDCDFVACRPIADILNDYPQIVSTGFFTVKTASVYANGILAARTGAPALRAIIDEIICTCKKFGTKNGIEHWGSYGTGAFQNVFSYLRPMRTAFICEDYERFLPISDKEPDVALAWFEDQVKGVPARYGDAYMVHLHMQGKTEIVSNDSQEEQAAFGNVEFKVNQEETGDEKNAKQTDGKGEEKDSTDNLGCDVGASSNKAGIQSGDVGDSSQEQAKHDGRDLHSHETEVNSTLADSMGDSAPKEKIKVQKVEFGELPIESSGVPLPKI